MATTELDWNSDVVKHYVRRNAWLPAARAQARAARITGREPKYLTFCAAQAIDVFLFLKEGVLKRDPKTDVVLNTYFCEKDETDFNEISRLIGAHERGFFGDFQDLILFEDDENTRGLDYDDISMRYDANVRKRLSIKKRHEHLKSAFPFDVANLDVYGTFFPPLTGVLSPMLRSVRTFLDWQTDAAVKDEKFDSFSIFLTSHVEDGKVSSAAQEQMIEMIEKNSATFSGFSQALNERFGTDDAATIANAEFNAFYCIALPKVVVSEAFNRGWSVTTDFAGQYRRMRNYPNTADGTSYAMLAWVGRFDRLQPEQLELGLAGVESNLEYAHVINELTRTTLDIDKALCTDLRDTTSDLDQVVTYREEFLNGILSTS